MKLVPLADAQKTWEAILAIDYDALDPVVDHRVTMTDFAQRLRAELKKLGFSNRKVSVRVPTYAQAMAIEVEIPNTSWAGVEDFEDAYEPYARAKAHMYGIILALFPFNGSRYGEGGIYSDAFYYTFSVD